MYTAESIKKNKTFYLFSVISRKRLDADKNLAKNLEEKSRLEIENAHKREEVLIFQNKVYLFYKI